MGVLKRLRPRTGFPFQVQAASVLIFATLFVALLASRKVPIWVKLTVPSLIWVIIWQPKAIVDLIQRCFDRRQVLFRYPGAPVKISLDANMREESVEWKLPPIALTIDDGPAWEYDQRPASKCRTEDIRQVMLKYGARATWFVIGSHAFGDRLALLRDLLQEGHELANHGMEDRPAVMLSREEFASDVEKTQAILETCGVSKGGRWFRPGHALFTPWKMGWLLEHGYRIAIGSVYPHDALDLPPWQCSNPKLIARHLVSRTRAGDVLIIHDRPWTAEVLELALPELTKHFTVCTLSDLDRAYKGSNRGDETQMLTAPTPTSSCGSPSSLSGSFYMAMEESDTDVQLGIGADVSRSRSTTAESLPLHTHVPKDI